MDPDRYFEFAPLIVSATQQSSPATSDAISEDEAEYCRVRAEEELIRAGEAWHPSARAAHLEMAALYWKRAAVARVALFAATGGVCKTQLPKGNETASSPAAASA